jgi:hypothetical protein
MFFVIVWLNLMFFGKKALDLWFDKIAMGHYARIAEDWWYKLIEMNRLY